MIHVPRQVTRLKATEIKSADLLTHPGTRHIHGTLKWIRILSCSAIHGLSDSGRVDTRCIISPANKTSSCSRQGAGRLQGNWSTHEMGIRFHWSSSSSSSLCSSFAGAAAANKRTRELFILVTGKQEEAMIQCRESVGTEGVVELPYPMCV